MDVLLGDGAVDEEDNELAVLLEFDVFAVAEAPEAEDTAAAAEEEEEEEADERPPLTTLAVLPLLKRKRSMPCSP